MRATANAEYDRIISYDVGSLPFDGDSEKLLQGARKYGAQDTGSTRYFRDVVIKGLLDKKSAGIDLPNFPQFRDMNEMFLESITGLKKIDGGYIVTDRFELTNATIPEVEVIKRNSDPLAKEIGGPFDLKLCVTGPYTLSSFLPHRDAEILAMFGEIITKIVDRNIFDTRKSRVRLVVVDEPFFGTVDDPLLDRGSEGREVLLKAWDSSFRKANSRGAETGIHIHCTTDELFWKARWLNVIETEAEDPLLVKGGTRKMLEREDKFLRASICITNFDRLIEKKVGSKPERIADAWTLIKRGTIDPEAFLEDVQTMERRLLRTIDLFGQERVPYAGPECGMRGFPSYKCAIQCLARVSKAVRSVNRGSA
ncbi:MAG: hypothetical protein ACE5OY_06700 [Candidatus Bathyarchaeia archaeon]